MRRNATLIKVGKVFGIRATKAFRMMGFAVIYDDQQRGGNGEGESTS